MSDIVVGYDGSPAGDQAVRWALAEGELHGDSVAVVHVIERPVTSTGEPGWLGEQEREAAEVMLRQAIAAAGGGRAAVEVLGGSVVGTLCKMSERARLVVVGVRGTGGFSGLLIGSVGLSVAVHASSPVTVVRGRDDVRRAEMPVVVGIDDSDHARKAVAIAFAEAEAHQCELVALRAWRPPPGRRDPEELETAELHQLREILGQGEREHPSVKVRHRLIAMSAGKSLVEASHEAQLLVVGSRGVGGFKGLLLGSVGQQVLHHAHCPVMVVR